MEEEKTIYKSIIEVMKKVNAISKDRKNQQQGFKFRGIDDVMNELHGTLAECGVFIVPTVLEENRAEGKTKAGAPIFYTRLKINFRFFAGDGSYIDAVVIGEAMDTADKASNKALSIGLKYALLQVFCIPTEDDKDPDAATPQPAATLPPQVDAAKKTFEGKVFAGGETTPAERDELKKLMASTYKSGARVFSKEEAIAYSAKREQLTAREVIDLVKKDLADRLAAESAPAEPAPQQNNFDIF